jgi:hypothetical protein
LYFIVYGIIRRKNSRVGTDFAQQLLEPTGMEPVDMEDDLLFHYVQSFGEKDSQY